MFIYSDNNKRYHTLDYHLKHKFGCKVFKVSLNGGFTCPNIDGTKGFGGCTYCSSQGSGDFAGNPELPIAFQFEQVKEKMHHKWNEAKYIAYFQAHTNTYAPLSTLKKMFEEVLTYENVVGISIATRADCLSNDIVDYLAELNQRTYLIVELGLQTIHDETAKKINRCHDYNTFLEGYQKLNDRNIPICVHIINGLPGETKEMMLETVKEISKLNIHSIKLHLLHVLKETVIAQQLSNHEFKLLELTEYVNIICDQIELLPPQVVIQRITGDGDKEQLIGPLWSLKKFVVMNEIDKELKRRNSYQGIKYNNNL
ncbi:TIGR01212 family radical SAM protein [Paludicola sp. MB14-C6]|uniref:TIGR01212 family radical SAM protein n=1 Tax=Paludihabitans sp. MB14-C6 TaxID=3070656 RepID=UPI0035A2BA87